MRTILIVCLVTLAIVAAAVSQRHWLVIALLSSDEPPALLARSDEGPGVRWLDEYFIVEEVAPDTFAIGEPRYHQQVFSYLIVGKQRALLFDAGPGLYDIRTAAESLTDLPIVFMPSHFHFDHVGNRVSFSNVAVVDLPYIRARAKDNRLALTPDEHLGGVEGFDAPTLIVDEWIAPGSNINLGGRTLLVIYTPGHTEDSISLFEEDTGIVFAGDFLYPGPLFAFLSNSSLSAYLESSDRLLGIGRDNVQILGAHRSAPPGAPRLATRDLSDLRRALSDIRDGKLKSTGFYPAIYSINARIELWAEPGWLQDW